MSFRGSEFVNGVDRYVTESMPTAKEEEISFGEIHCQSKTKTEAYSNVDFNFYSWSWKEMDRHWNTTITRSWVLWSFKSHHPIATWSISPLRKRRSDPPQWHHRRVQEAEVRRRFAMVTWRLEIKTGNGRRSKEKISILRESKLFQSIPEPSSNSRTFRRKCYWSCVARQYTDSERIYRVPSPRREREWIEFYYEKWINSRRNKPQKKEDKRSSSLPWIRWRRKMAWGKLH